MKMMTKFVSAVVLSMTCAVSMAAGGSYPWDKAPNRLNDNRQQLFELPQRQVDALQQVDGNWLD
jgi:hypothetical protein